MELPPLDIDGPLPGGQARARVPGVSASAADRNPGRKAAAPGAAGRIRSAIADGRRRLKRLRTRALGAMLGRTAQAEYIPLQVLSRTVFEHDVRWYGEDDLYAPDASQRAPSAAHRFLALNNLPQALPRPYHFSVPDAVLAGHVIDPRNPGRVFVELLPNAAPARKAQALGPSTGKRRRLATRALASPPAAGKGFIFSAQSWENYYHFVVDCAVRYVGLDESGAIADCSIILDGPPNRWQGEYLELLGIDRSACILAPGAGEPPLRVADLVIASPHRARFACSGKAIARLRARMLEAVGVTGPRPERRIYVSRKSAARRRLLNGDEVIALAERNGFETFVLEDLSVAEQVRLFSEAHTIMGPHGAGLTNLVYAHRPKLIEFIPVDRWNFGFFLALSNAVGGLHVPLVSERATDGRYIRTDAEDADYAVDLAELRRHL
jgi:hypothetical protein